MDIIHKDLASGRWFTFSLIEQLAHIGSEVNRALSWIDKHDPVTARNAIDRALELLDLTIADSRWRFRLKELLRLRELLCDRFYGSNDYKTSGEFLKKYFLAYAIMARRARF